MSENESPPRTPAPPPPRPVIFWPALLVEAMRRQPIVTVPCRFSDPEGIATIRGIWHSL